ncbi:hypothetical protein [Sphingomonas solaris]|uniref:Alpha/beta hydrolase n=1 Tax=Alterirhizorhabdus solaris TaxID=2529389 RepID=A0A558R6N5_9SPHN|nr:hypothetical protein [Sphingomonas solaris]TVV74988.1 hypothetical protein FOY91_08395 [Sphingomonas solaris]
MSLRFEPYRWRGGEEWMAVRGPAAGPRVMIVPPLFEENNFTRATLTAMVIDLAAHGIGTWLIDLPGTGESAISLDMVGWEDWRAAVAAAAEVIGRPHILSLRGGALLDDAATAASRLRVAPAGGATLLRQMERAQAIGDREAGRGPPDPAAATVDLIGYAIDRALVAAMRAATVAAVPCELREMPFTGPGVAPWRKAEPTPDAAFAAMLASDLAEWVTRCGG